MNASRTTRRIGSTRALAMVAAGILVLTISAPVLAAHYGPWAVAVNAETLPGTSPDLNTEFTDGCPIQSPDGLSLYMASTRTGGLGGLDIWVAHRSSTADPYGSPMHLPAPINSGADDFCPTPVRGNGLFFVSARVVDGACGAGDIYFARENPAHGWTDPVNLGCDVNSAAGEAAPSYFEADGSAYLYFSRGPDIYASLQLPDGTFATASPVAELNSASNDFRPNVTKNGLEIVFDSNRTGTLGGQDLWFATRTSVSDPWSTPVNAGPNLNTPDNNETRGSFSWDGLTLYFGRTPLPMGSTTDIFVTTRTKVSGG